MHSLPKTPSNINTDSCSICYGTGFHYSNFDNIFTYYFSEHQSHEDLVLCDGCNQGVHPECYGSPLGLLIYLRVSKPFL